MDDGPLIHQSDPARDRRGALGPIHLASVQFVSDPGAFAPDDDRIPLAGRLLGVELAGDLPRFPRRSWPTRLAPANVHESPDSPVQNLALDALLIAQAAARFGQDDDPAPRLVEDPADREEILQLQGEVPIGPVRPQPSAIPARRDGG